MSDKPTAQSLQARALSLYTESLDVPAEQRHQWVAAQCAESPELMSMVVHLLSAEPQGGGSLESRPLHPGFKDRSGERVGRYQLEERLGGGGMGTVYRAQRADGSFRQKVAVKLIRADLVNEEIIARFTAERQILAQLDHPGIARLIDGGSTEEGIPYVVMELVEGAPIDQHCAQRQLGMSERLRLFIQICEALQTAHRAGIVHRDIKPGNILVTAEGQIKLLDFGIAKVLEADRFDEVLPETRTGMVALTPQYASPEQVRGRPLGPQSDVYALGVLLYELLTGSRPYSVATLTPAELERLVCNTIPPDPSEAVARRREAPPPGLDDVQGLRRQLRGDLDRIVMTALRKEAGKRYRDAGRLAEDLERYLEGQPVLARGASKIYRAGKFVGRHRGVALAALIAFISLISALIVVTIQAREAERQRDAAEQHAARAEAAKEFLVDMVGRADPFSSPESATLVEALKQSIGDIDERFAGQPELAAEMRYAIGYALQNLGEIPAAREQLEAALVFRRVEGPASELARVLDGLAIVHWWESEFSESEARFNEALDVLGDRSDSEANEIRLSILTSFAGMLSEPGEYQRAVAVARQGVNLAQRMENPDISIQATLWNNLATAQESLDLNDEALQSFEHALFLRRQSDGELSPDYAITLNNQSFLQVKLGDLKAAADTLRRAVEIQRELLGDTHQETATTMLNLAWVLNNAGHYDEAEANALMALDISQKRYPDGHPRTGKAHETIAQIYLTTGRLKEAREHLVTALAMYAVSEEVNPGWIEVAEELLADVDEAMASEAE